MNIRCILIVSIFIFVIIIIYNYLKRKEKFISNMDGFPMYLMDESYHTTNRPDLDMKTRESHSFLERSVLPGKIDIVNLHENNKYNTGFYYIGNKKQEFPNSHYYQPNKSKILSKNPDITCITDNSPIKKIIKKYQPYIYDNKVDIINYYDNPYYRDWRYGEKPVSVKFASDPKKFCEKNPIEYPCAKYYSKW